MAAREATITARRTTAQYAIMLAFGDEGERQGRTVVGGADYAHSPGLPNVQFTIRCKNG